MKVSYRKNWSKDGTFYNQTITIDKKTAALFNDYVERALQRDKEEIQKNHIITNEQSMREYYLKRLAIGANYTYLTTLDHFISFYLKAIYEPPKKDKDFERILNRNTIIFVK